MKWIGRIVLGLLSLAVIVIAVYAMYRFLIPIWVAIAYYSYLAIGIFGGVIGLIVLINNLKSPVGVRSTITQSLADAATVRSLAWFRNVLAHVLGAIESALVWPVGATIGVWRARQQQDEMDDGRYAHTRNFLIHFSLHPLEQLHSVYAAIFVCLAFGFGIIGLRGNGYGSLFVVTVASSVFLRHLRYAVEAEGLAVRLRKAVGIPYITYVTLVLCDLVTLVLACALLLTKLPPAGIGINDLVSSAGGLFRFRELLRLFSGASLSPAEIAVALVGLVFYISLVRILLRFKEFRRTDADYNVLAMQYTLLGEFTTAARQLKCVKSRTPETELIEVIGLLGVNQLQLAKERAKRFLTLKDLSTDKDPVFRVLCDVCIVAPIPDHVVYNVLNDGIQSVVADVLLQNAICVLVTGSSAVAAKLENNLNDTDQQYVLSRAELAMARGDFHSARELLAKVNTENPLDAIVHAGQSLRAAVLDPDATRMQESNHFLDWVETKLPVIVQQLTRLSEPFEKTTAFGELSFARIVAMRFHKDRAQEIAYHTDRLKEQITGNPEAELNVKAIELRIARFLK